MRLLSIFCLLLIFCPVIADLQADEQFDLGIARGVHIGMSADQALALLPYYSFDQFFYDENPDCYYLQPSDDKPGPFFMVRNNRISRVDIYDTYPQTRTSRGIGIGSSKAEVLANYSNVHISSHPYMAPLGEYLEVRLVTGLGLIFETYKDRVTSFRVGSYPTLRYIEGCL